MNTGVTAEDVELQKQADERDRITIVSNYPDTLAKACDEPSHYIMGVRSRIIWFTEAVPLIGSKRGWVMLHGADIDGLENSGRLRTVNVRVSEIEWVGEAKS
jgi:hypothetical protein